MIACNTSFLDQIEVIWFKRTVNEFTLLSTVTQSGLSQVPFTISFSDVQAITIYCTHQTAFIA